MNKSDEERVDSAISLYTRKLLFVYDWLLLGSNCRFLWRCPAHHLLKLYNENVTSNHLDIGVGSGYFMDKCRFPSPRPRLVLMDLNHNSLNMAGKRLARYKPETYHRNVLEPFNLDIPPFDSVGIMNLLHCLPGDMKTKGVVFRNISEVLKAEGVLFGSSIMYKGLKKNPMAGKILDMVNRRGIMTNLEDTVDDLKESLDRYFTESSVNVIGYEVLFRARK
jgi:SAM-dependent methyltransferase